MVLCTWLANSRSIEAVTRPVKGRPFHPASNNPALSNASPSTGESSSRRGRAGQTRSRAAGAKPCRPRMSSGEIHGEEAPLEPCRLAVQPSAGPRRRRSAARSFPVFREVRKARWHFGHPRPGKSEKGVGLGSVNRGLENGDSVHRLGRDSGLTERRRADELGRSLLWKA